MRHLALAVLVALLATSCAARADSVEELTLDNEAPVLSGRTALADAQGKPHVLWFWGAH